MLVVWMAESSTVAWTGGSVGLCRESGRSSCRGCGRPRPGRDPSSRGRRCSPCGAACGQDFTHAGGGRRRGAVRRALAPVWPRGRRAACASRRRYARLARRLLRALGRFIAPVGMSGGAALLAWEPGCGPRRPPGMRAGTRGPGIRVGTERAWSAARPRPPSWQGSQFRAGHNVTVGGCGNVALLPGEQSHQPTPERRLLDVECCLCVPVRMTVCNRFQFLFQKIVCTEF
jgi:hypothetical protein